MRKKRNKGSANGSASLRVLATVAGTESEIKSGLLAWLTVEIDGTLILDGLTLRRTVDGRFTVSFPLRRDPKGNRHVLIQPVDAEARRRVETAILEQIDLARPNEGRGR